MDMNVNELGQVFTQEDTAKFMVSLKQNDGRILEPSCGNGVFLRLLPQDKVIGLEVDKNHCPETALLLDFFEYPITEKFDTVIGNPPYVKYRSISASTKNILQKSDLDFSLFDERSNLYLFFIYKSILHLNPGGELIFIVPRDFLKATSAMKLNDFMYKHGTITHLKETGDATIFKNATPNCIIFRFEKDNFSRKTTIVNKQNETHSFLNNNGHLLFLKNNYSIKFSDLFFVKVGAVSGADKIFTNIKGNKEFVTSKTRNTKKTTTMFYNIEAPELIPYKEQLLQRKIKTFSNNNWYMWGRNLYESNLPRIYVNAKTRVKNPFFTHSCKNYDGSVLAIFPKDHHIDTEKATILLNDVNWDELGFVCDGRYLFSQKSLENCLLPDSFKNL